MTPYQTRASPLIEHNATWVHLLPTAVPHCYHVQPPGSATGPADHWSPPLCSDPKHHCCQTHVVQQLFSHQRTVTAAVPVLCHTNSPATTAQSLLPCWGCPAIQAAAASLQWRCCCCCSCHHSICWQTVLQPYSSAKGGSMARHWCHQLQQQ